MWPDDPDTAAVIDEPEHPEPALIEQVMLRRIIRGKRPGGRPVPGGDLDKCIEYSNKALKYDADNVTANLYLGKAYYKQDKLSEAKERLEHIIATANPKTASDKEDVAEAKELLEKVKADMGE